MSRKNTRQVKARSRTERARWQVTERPGYYSAVRDNGPGVTVQAAGGAMLERAAAGERLPRGCTALDVRHRMTGRPGDEDPRLRPAVPDGGWRWDGD
jgi:hypothetical protein